MTANTPESFAAILAAHGDRGGPSPNAALHAQAERVAALLPDTPLYTGMLKGEPKIEDALAMAGASGRARIAVYPLFMADGYFVRKLGDRINEAGYGERASLLTPLGLDPALPDVLSDEAAAAAETRAFELPSSRLLIVGHGSKLGPASATSTRKVATRVALLRKFASVTTAFLEEEPFLDDALRATNQPTIVSGFFFGEGMHGSDDVLDAISETGANAIYAGAIGNSPAIAPLIAAALSGNTTRIGRSEAP